jgi:excisionase family DNA binding protein
VGGETDMGDDGFYTKDAAKYLGVSIPTVHMWTRKRKIKFTFVPGKGNLFSKDALDEKRISLRKLPGEESIEKFIDRTINGMTNQMAEED